LAREHAVAIDGAGGIVAHGPMEVRLSFVASVSGASMTEAGAICPSRSWPSLSFQDLCCSDLAKLATEGKLSGQGLDDALDNRRGYRPLSCEERD
jgi:hypothetical protein